MLSIIHKFVICTNTLAFIRLALQSRQNKEQRAQFSASAVYWVLCPNLERGIDYLRDAHLHKGLAFTLQERQVLGLQGLLSGGVKTQEEQVAICKYSFDRFDSPLNKYLYLSELLEMNERLFFSLVATDVEKFLPILYTPTVGLACQRFGLVYRKPRGLFVNIFDKGHVYAVMKNWPIHDVRAICVTDGERILGLGDLGAYGMGIPIGKLSLYTALAGIKPHQCLPIVLDVGTDNEELLVDPLYIGIRHKRVRGEEYHEFVEEFMQACVKRYGRTTLIQFEDFALPNAGTLLNRYRERFCTFNDDIQGTAGVVVAGVFGAARITKKKVSENKFLFLGAGSAGVGIADLLVDAMVEEGLDKKAAQDKIYLFDIDGLLTSKRQSGLPAHAKHFGKDLEPTKDFAKAVETLKPTCLIGASTQGGAFTPAILKQMAKNTERPIIFALSNPTDKAECTAQAAYDNTEGRCVYSSGSPFPPVKYNNKTYYTGQGNNSYVFPGIALGVIAAEVTKIPDSLFLTAARSVADMCTAEDIDVGRVYPPLSNIRKISFEIAKKIVERAYKLNIASVYPTPTDLDAFIQHHIYKTKYLQYVPELYTYPPSEYKTKSIEQISEEHKKKFSQ
ncbi:NADP-dependent malic enzyme-like isoform X3 [Anticarsia gemmatalis]|uniref:NADP-dependent malic enzyme-like isoform X3 n=1 Tax=Anticarsia gemmatalis TaxID=129554 RepID=UPI003F7761F1